MTTDQKARELAKLGALLVIVGALLRAPWTGGVWQQALLYVAGIGLLAAIVVTAREGK